MKKRRHDSSEYDYSKKQKNDERKYETNQGMIRNKRRHGSNMTCEKINIDIAVQQY